jgi:hypothetical protein
LGTIIIIIVTILQRSILMIITTHLSSANQYGTP